MNNPNMAAMATAIAVRYPVSEAEVLPVLAGYPSEDWHTVWLAYDELHRCGLPLTPKAVEIAVAELLPLLHRIRQSYLDTSEAQVSQRDMTLLISYLNRQGCDIPQDATIERIMVETRGKTVEMPTAKITRTLSIDTGTLGAIWRPDDMAAWQSDEP